MCLPKCSLPTYHEAPTISPSVLDCPVPGMHSHCYPDGEDSYSFLRRALQTSPDVFRLSLLFSECQLVLQLPLPVGKTPSSLYWLHTVNTIFYYGESMPTFTLSTSWRFFWSSDFITVFFSSLGHMIAGEGHPVCRQPDYHSPGDSKNFPFLWHQRSVEPVLCTLNFCFLTTNSSTLWSLVAHASFLQSLQ